MSRSTSKSRLPAPAPLQPLLFWETGILLFATGVLGVRFPLPALVVTGLILLVDNRIRKPACLIFALACIGLGFLHGQSTLLPPPPEPPDWLARKLEHPRNRALRITGTVVETKGLPDQRIRLILKDVLPAKVSAPPSPAPPQAQDSEFPLPSLLVWTWEYPTVRPLPGQQVTATLSIRPVRGFHNGDTEGSEAYWFRQGIHFQAWSRGERPFVTVSGQPEIGAALRERLRLLVVAALRPSFSLPNTDASASETTSASFLSATQLQGTPDDSRGWNVIPALLFGDRFFLQTKDMERINAAGLGHSLALSGQHLAVTGFLALLLVTTIRFVRPSIFLHIPANALTGLLTLPPAAFYLWLGNAPPSLIRAALMLLVWCVFRCLPSCLPKRLACARPLAFPDALLLALLCMLIMDPSTLHDTGAQLSFAAVAGIALCSPLLASGREYGPFSRTASFHKDDSLPTGIGKAALRLFRLTLICSVAAQLATLPLVLHIFGYTTLWFPLNLLWLPVLGFFVLPVSFLGLAFLGLGLPAIGTDLLQLAVVPCDLLLDGLVRLQGNAGLSPLWLPRPHWTALPGFAAVGIALALLPGRGRLPAAGKRLLAAGCLLLLIGPLIYLHGQQDKDTVLKVLDVGQAQAILLEWSKQDGRGRALVDGGGFLSDRFDSGRDIVAPLLSRNHPMTLDFLALTHPDRDHLRGLLFLADHFSPEAVHTTELEGIDIPATSKRNTQERTSPLFHASESTRETLILELISILARHGIPRHTPTAGTRIHLSETLWLEILAPLPGTTPKGNNGLVLRLVQNGKGLALLPGDAGASYLRALLRRDVDLSADVLVLPHHGSRGSLVPAFLDAVSPKIALVSSGAFNAFGHPAPAVRKALEERNIPLYITAREGALAVRWHGDGRLKALPGKTAQKTCGLPDLNNKTELFHTD